MGHLDVWDWVLLFLVMSLFVLPALGEFILAVIHAWRKK